MLGHHRPASSLNCVSQAGRWWSARSGILDPSPNQTKKNVVKVGTPLTKHSGSAHAIVVIHFQGLKAIPHISDYSEKTWLNKGADQSAHPASLMRDFVVYSLESIIATLNLAHSKLQASNEQAGFSKLRAIAHWAVHSTKKHRFNYSTKQSGNNCFITAVAQW